MSNQKKEVVFVKKRTKKNYVVLLVLLFFTIAFFIFKMFLPDILFEMGKTMYNAKDYPTSAELFKNAYKFSSKKNTDYTNYWVLSLSHLPMSYYVQKDLYSISQLDDGSRAEMYATKILTFFRGKILAKVGDNYIEDALNDSQVLRWNLGAQPLSYCIVYDTQVPDYYPALVEKAFSQWHRMSNGLVKFQQIQNIQDANIVVSFIDVDSSKLCHGNSCEYSVGTTVPVVQDDLLKYMDVKINVKNNLRQFFSPEDISTVLVHEVGHSLGIWGHSKYISDVMFYSADKLYGDEGQKHISQRDINTLRLLYSLAPDITNQNSSVVSYERFFYAPIFFGDISRSKAYNIDRAMKNLRENPDDTSNWLELASRYSTDKQYEKSNEILSQALFVARDPQTVSVIYYNMASNYLYLSKNQEALQLAYKAQQLNDDFETKSLIALIKSANKDYKGAESDFVKLRQEQPSNIDLALNLTDMYINKKDYVKAHDTVKSLLSSNPKAKDDPRLAGYKLYALF